MSFRLASPLSRVSGLLLICMGLLASTTRCGVPGEERGLSEDAAPVKSPATTTPASTPLGTQGESTGNMTTNTDPTSDGNAKTLLAGNYLAVQAANIAVGPVVGGAFVPAASASLQAKFRFDAGKLEVDGKCLASANGSGPGQATTIDCSDANAILWFYKSPTLNYGMSQRPKPNTNGVYYNYGLQWTGCAVPKAVDGNCRLQIVEISDYKLDAARLLPRDASTGQAVFGASLSLSASPTQCLTDTGATLVFATCVPGTPGQSWLLNVQPGGTVGYASPASDLGGCVGLAGAMPPTLERYPCKTARNDSWGFWAGYLFAQRITAREGGQDVGGLILVADDSKTPMPQLVLSGADVTTTLSWGQALVSAAQANP